MENQEEWRTLEAITTDVIYIQNAGAQQWKKKANTHLERERENMKKVGSMLEIQAWVNRAEEMSHHELISPSLILGRSSETYIGKNEIKREKEGMGKREHTWEDLVLQPPEEGGEIVVALYYTTITLFAPPSSLKTAVLCKSHHHLNQACYEPSAIFRISMRENSPERGREGEEKLENPTP